MGLRLSEAVQVVVFDKDDTIVFSAVLGGDVESGCELNTWAVLTKHGKHTGHGSLGLVL